LLRGDREEEPRGRLHPRHDPARLCVPGRQVLRVRREDPALPGRRLARGLPAARRALRRPRAPRHGCGCRRDADLLLALLRDDGPARAAHDRRRADPAHDRVPVLEGTLRPRVPHTGRARGALLALRRHHLDLPVPAALPDRAPLMSQHVVSWKVYLGVFLALVTLTVATVVVAGFDFGEFNLVVALAVAVTKATLVVLYFMH